MKSLEQIAKEYKSNTIDGRDLNRLAQFIPFNMLSSFGLEAKEGVTEESWNSKVIEFSKENILKQLESDVSFGFEKALNQRGLSAGMMYEVVSMWNWVLEEGLENFNSYSYYGLPLFKATANKYGFPDEIEGEEGDEYHFNE